MDDIDIGVMNQVHEIVVAGHLSESCLFGHSLSAVQTGLVYVTKSHQAVGHLEVVAATDTAEADDTLCQLIAGSNVTFAAKHVAGQNGERSYSRGPFEELSSTCHNAF